MYITVKGLTFAKFEGGGNGSTPFYTSGVQKPNLTVRADVNFEYAEGQDYADGVRIAHKRKIIGVSTAFELADLPQDIKMLLLGWKDTIGDDLAITDATPKYYGIGFYIWNEEPLSEDDNYIAYWIYKSRFSVDGISVATSNDSISYQHQTINGRGVGVKPIAADKSFYFVTTNKVPFSTEDEAVEWLKSAAWIGAQELPVEETGVTGVTGELPVEEAEPATGG